MSGAAMRKIERKTGSEVCVRLWRCLRQPFVLPPLAHSRHHACEWEHVDVDVLGCLVCGAIHACSMLACKETVKTSDGVVCALSGVVIHEKMFAENEFLDTIAMTGPSQLVEDDMCADVQAAVRSMLDCKAAFANHRKVLCRTLLGWALSMHTLSANRAVCCGILARRACSHPYLFAWVSKTRRKELVQLATHECRRILRLMVCSGMPVKANEVHRLTIGVMYLMKHGITSAHEVTLRPQPDIHKLLPPESMLNLFYGIHPKFITETENRVKFCLRSQLSG